MKTNKVLLSGIAAGFALMSTQAVAGGSIGGDCCADLEERVAELEATTVRKGNRKVSLKLSGHVNKSLFWVSGDIDNDGPVLEDTATSQSRFRLTGKAKITSDLYAGYAIEYGVAENASGTLNLRKNEMYIGSKTLGKISIGQGSDATDGIAEIDLSGTNYLGGGTLLISTLSGPQAPIANILYNNLDGGRSERIRYDSPSLAGFKLSASWQDQDNADDSYDIALRYAGAFGDFKVAAGIGLQDDDGFETVSGSISGMHVPTGLNLTFAAGDADDVYDYWFIQGGIKQKVFAAGATAFSVGYMSTELAGVDSDAFSVTLVQNVDAAAMELYASYTAHDVEDEVEVDTFMVGSRIKF